MLLYIFRGWEVCNTTDSHSIKVRNCRKRKMLKRFNILERNSCYIIILINLNVSDTWYSGLCQWFKLVLSEHMYIHILPELVFVSIGGGLGLLVFAMDFWTSEAFLLMKIVFWLGLTITCRLESKLKNQTKENK